MAQAKFTYQNVLALIVFSLAIYGGYRVFVDYLVTPLISVERYVGAMQLENKVLLVILLLGVFAIYSFRTRKTPPPQS